MKQGDVVKDRGGFKTGLLVDEIQKAWGAKKFRVLWDDGVISYVWDKHIEVISEQ